MASSEEPLSVLVARMLDQEARERAPDIRRRPRQPRSRSADHGVVPPGRRSSGLVPTARQHSDGSPRAQPA